LKRRRSRLGERRGELTDTGLIVGRVAERLLELVAQLFHFGGFRGRLIGGDLNLLSEGEVQFLVGESQRVLRVASFLGRRGQPHELLCRDERALVDDEASIQRRPSRAARLLRSRSLVRTNNADDDDRQQSEEQDDDAVLPKTHVFRGKAYRG